MIYNLKKDNYKTFNVFKDNILDPRSYFIPFANENEMLESDIRALCFVHGGGAFRRMGV